MAKRKPPEKKKFESRSQIDIQDDGKYQAPAVRNWRDFDKMARHPTIRLALDVRLAMCLAVPWTVEGKDPDVNAYMQRQYDAHKKRVARSALMGFFKRGWRIFEVLYGIAYDDLLGPRQTIDGVRALRNEITYRVMDPDTGEMLGCLQEAQGRSNKEVFIDADHTCFVNQDDDGYGEYGEATMENAHSSWRKWIKCDDGAERYDDKVAGGFTLMKYPVGSSKYGADGTLTDHSAIADDILRRLKSAGMAKVPIQVYDEATGEPLRSQEMVDAWRVEVVSAAGALQPGFVSREKYLDAMMMRAFGLPERSATEGTFGTKAEAEAHADIALLVASKADGDIVDAIQAQIGQPLNESNWGDPGMTKLTLGKLDPDSRALFVDIFKVLMADPVHADEVNTLVDKLAVMHKLDIPVLDRTSSFGETADDVG